MPKRIAPPPRRPGASLSYLLSQQQVEKLEKFGHACDAAYSASLRAGYLKAGIIKQPAKEHTAA